MKSSIPIFKLFLSLLALAFVTECNAQIVTFSSTTVIPVAPCDHVMQMIMRYGVNNQLNRMSGCQLLNQATVTGIPGAMTGAMTGLGDLEILLVNALPTPGASSGPKFAISIMNHGSTEVRDFHVSVVAALGQIHSHSPISTVRVDRIGAGQAIEVVAQLPVEALAMGRLNGNVQSYDRLIVAVDCFNKISEYDEANNVRLFEYSQLHPTASNLSSPSSLRSQVPALSILENPNFGLFKSTAPDSHRSVVDALDLDQPTPDSLRSAIQSVSPPPANNSLLPPNAP
ncbi:MAG: CARDB domain-containing protein [Pirellulales bacterium]